MSMPIIAKQAGWCDICGSDIVVGDRIEYHKRTKKAVHFYCAVYSAIDEPFVVRFTGIGKRACPEIGFVFRDEESGHILTVVRVESRYVSQEEVEELDAFDYGGDPFWEFIAFCREATPEEAQVVLDKEAAAKAEVEERQRALDEIQRKANECEAEFSRLIEGLTAAGPYFPVCVSRELIMRWGDKYSRGIPSNFVFRVVLEDGSVGYTRETRISTDWRYEFWGTKAACESAWRKWAERNNMTVEKAKEWLASFEGCYGHEGYEWVVAQKGGCG